MEITNDDTGGPLLQQHRSGLYLEHLVVFLGYSPGRPAADLTTYD